MASRIAGRANGDTAAERERDIKEIYVYIYIYIVLEQILVFQTPPKPHHMRGAHGGRLKEERERESLQLDIVTVEAKY